LVGAADAAAALAFIFVGFVEGEVVPPFAVIGIDGEVERRSISEAPGDYSFFDGAETVITILAPIHEDNRDSKEDAIYDFDNKTEAVLDEISAVSQSTGKLIITGVRSGVIEICKAEESRSFRDWFMQRTIRIAA